MLDLIVGAALILHPAISGQVTEYYDDCERFGKPAADAPAIVHEYALERYRECLQDLANKN